jgi:antibiotic biosynthesis monooxygenase (ABM) superfamily enzyme
MTVPMTTTVTLVSAVRLHPGGEDEHAELHAVAVEEAERHGGLVRAELIPAIPEVQPDTVALLTFTDRSALDRWLESPQRRLALTRMSRLTEGERTLTVVGDFAGWFSPTTTIEPQRWKQAVAVLLGLAPVALLTATLRQLLLPDLPQVAAVPITSICNIAALTWLVMPMLTRVLRPWLSR